MENVHLCAFDATHIDPIMAHRGNKGASSEWGARYLHQQLQACKLWGSGLTATCNHPITNVHTLLDKYTSVTGASQLLVPLA